VVAQQLDDAHLPMTALLHHSLPARLDKSRILKHLERSLVVEEV
jgi:hypothetical protein